MKKVRFFFTLIICAAVLLLVITFKIERAGADVKEVNLGIRPEKVLFHVENMAPGDWAIRDLTIINNGEKNIRYAVSIQYTSGSKLFNELDLEVTQGDTSLYKGKLAKLIQLTPRQLLKSQEEVLTFRVGFPPELGNDFQGLETKFNVVISAEDIKDNGEGTPPGENPNPSNPDQSNPDPINPDKDQPPRDNETTNPDSTDPKNPDNEDPDGDKTLQVDNDQDIASPVNNHDGNNNPSDEPGSTDSPEPIGEGSGLPNTATHMFNYMIGGVMLMVTGLTSIFILRRRKSIDKKL